MAFARKHGKQIAIVHGERDRETGKVQQRVLFALYSKEEARSALRGLGPPGYFKDLMREKYPNVTFNWKKIKAGIQAHMDMLPEEYAGRRERVAGEFHEALLRFSRQLILNDPQSLFSSAELVRSHRLELEYLRDLIEWRLKTCDQEQNEWNTDRFGWRYESQGRDATPSAEEFAAAYYEHHDLDRAEAAFKILTHCFEDYAEGHNYLGSIAMDRGNTKAAIEHFRRAIEIGRRLFPKRISKSSYWTDLNTRPYMRGLRQLASALGQSGGFTEALQICRRLEEECDDAETAAYQRALIHLNAGHWQQACEWALKVNAFWSQASFVACFAKFELGEAMDALTWLLHGALNRPRLARLLVASEALSDPATAMATLDHNTGLDLMDEIGPYLDDLSNLGPLMLEYVLNAPYVQALLGQRERLEQRWEAERNSDAFKEMERMKTIKFAEDAARTIYPLLTVDGSELGGGRDGAHRDN